MSEPAHELISKGTQEAVTFGLALLGAVLGVVNVWRAISRDRIRLRVSPRWYAHTSDMKSGICVEVVNLGFFPVTISQIGFLVSTKQKQIIYPDTFFLDRESLPHRLEARASLTAYIPAAAQDDKVFRIVTCAFATTACGTRFTGKSPYLRDCIKAARAA